MLRRILAIIIFAATAMAFLAGCGPSYSFTEAQGKYKLMGLTTQVKLDNFTLYFEGADSAANTQITADTQSIIDFARSKLDLPGIDRKIALCWQSGGKPSLVGGDVNRIMISTTDPTSAGSVVSVASDYKLPAWLCAGIELYALHGSKPAAWLKADPSLWAADARVAGGPAFGDTWFLPDVGTPELKRGFLAACYAVVSTLEAQGTLAPTVAAYLAGDRQGAADIAAGALAPVGDIDNDSTYVYGNDGRYLEIDRKALYIFKEWHWDLPTVLRYAEFMDLAEAFVCQWLEYEPAQKVSVHLTHVGDASANRFDLNVAPTRIEIYTRDASELPYTFPHEYTHALADQICSGAFILPINEGLAEAVRYEMFEAGEIPPSLLSIAHEWLGYFGTHEQEEPVYTDMLALYARAAGQPYDEADGLDLYAYAQLCAYSNVRLDYYKSPFKETYSEQPLIDDYAKSCAFVYYLLRTYGKETMLSAIESREAFETVYGASLGDMVNEWAAWLGLEG